MTAAGMRAVVLAALAAGGGVVALILDERPRRDKPVWAVFQPAVGWIFIGTGLYAWRRRPESRTGALMVAMGFAWLLAALEVVELAAGVHVRARGGRPVRRACSCISA